jgi:hypothetical protein
MGIKGILISGVYIFLINQFKISKELNELFLKLLKKQKNH